MSEALAKRAVASKHWRWMPGMRVIHCEDFPGNTARIHTVTTDGFWAKDYDVGTDDHWDVEDRATPDLDDSATLGCLLALVREAWGMPEIGITVDTRAAEAHYWKVGHELRFGFSALSAEDTEAEALVAALEAAP